MAGVRRKKEMPLAQITPKKIDAFCAAIKNRFVKNSGNLGKEYLRRLVEEVRVDGENLVVKGSYFALAGMLKRTKVGAEIGVPTFGCDWLPTLDVIRTFFSIPRIGN